ncbi:probable G-protein coupled receptor Mth-like 10 isoform X6 [Anoplophora glabripennis]|uniref:probable G-protein coupled receptor Mth-like 10 isoform X6 n=1 Tax=Anoplophora glabripennis TaxID=217634 RepID=UPI0008758E48|nr:probable G-protein coupled receptor Mth-like 10 isoform X6 [Anoplophora glabripennis]
MFSLTRVLVVSAVYTQVAALNSSESYATVNHNTNDDYRLCNAQSPCVRKCCQEHYVLRNRKCVYSDEHEFNLKVHRGVEDVSETTDATLNVIHDDKCYQQRLALIPAFNENQAFFLQTNGSLFKPYDELRAIIPFNHFCLETIIFSETTQHFAALVCYNETTLLAQKEKKYCFGMIISMPFLLATFLVYAILPESNLHRKALMNYVLTLFLAYIFLVIVQLYPGKFDENFVCPALGYLIIFFFLISFFWMNVMCLDMWFAFRGMRGFNGRRLAEKKRFLMYFAYAVGVPSLHILVVFLINKFGNNESDYFPGIGYEKCFLRDGLPNLLYFYGPMAILITVNVTLFILTAVKIQRVKKETSMLKQSDSKRHSYEDDKQNITEHVNKKTNTLYRFNLYVKLLFAMGINWTMEVISWAIEWRTKDIPSYIWYLTDFCNAMYGVFIFFIFVFKKKIWRSLKKRYYVFIGKPHFAHSVSVTQTTRSSNYSTTETGLNDHRLSELNNGRGEERMLHQN